MEQLTLLEQELNREPNIPDHYIEGEPFAYKDGYKTGFKDGTEWQKEQDKEIIDELKDSHFLFLELYKYIDGNNTIKLITPFTLELLRNRMANLLKLTNKYTK